MAKRGKIFSTLYWQISAIFLLVLLVFGLVALRISVQSARNYAIEVNQKLNRELAAHTVQELKPFLNHGVINEKAIQDIMHSMMVINPSVEVYLLDPNGKILSYVAPKKVVKLETVSLAPVKTFLESDKGNIIYGDDPRNPGESKIFSAAKVIEDNQLMGYIYIVLASQEYVSVSEMVEGSYILALSIKTMVTILIVSALIGLILIWIITQKLNKITEGIRHFREGDLKSRITVKNNDELGKIGTAFNEMAATIEQNIEELKGVDKLRVELISNISHDLRTPISNIQGFAETLLIKQENISNEDRNRYLTIIFEGCERLKKLVNDLFELSKLQANQVKLNKEPFSVGELVHDVAHKYRLTSQKKGISINTIVAKNTPLVEADIYLIDRVLQNLIDNAIKFCEDGDTINIEVDSADMANVRLRIADTGTGIKSEMLPHIFERYYKGAEYKTSSGLGLAIVKNIIEQHHSDISVESTVGQGTVFTFTLPVANMAV
ncbi:HAMP domain-containing sensor histidine kinase [Limibacter armeniacum]|uniref:sensor histidine kinase n=1 Tax=Limibacter armeniacum TaxID=466084 RepID=UPI002FE66D3F